jgi:putative OPT family oligopeptide transporter
MDTAASEPVPPLPAPAPRPRELTARALLFGSGLGAVLAAGNVYTGLKTSFIDGGSITAALLGFAFFGTFKRFAGTPYTSLENNISQTTASSAGIMGFAVGFPGAIPALNMLGYHYPGWALAIWGIALGLVGIVIGGMLRRKLVLVERLPFPTGAATAEVIETIGASRQTAMLRARLLITAALLSMVFAWFRDGRPSFIPQTTAFGLTIYGISLANLTVGFSWSPLMAATGMMMGLRSAASMLLGSTASWVVLGPWIAHRGIVNGTGFGACSAWLIWPGVGLLLASSFVPLVMDWRALLRSFADIPALLRRRGAAAAEAPLDERDRFRLGLPLLLISIAVMLVLGRVTFHMSALGTLVGVLLALVLANVCARSAGETDIAPTGAVGTLTQIMFTGSGHVASLVGGSIVSGAASQTAQTLWALKAGDRLKASANAQLWAQILGALVGAVVTVPAYLALTSAYGIGTEAMPAPSALSWKATAEAVGGGLAAMPQYAPLAGALAFAVGVVFAAAGRTKWGRFVPSPAAMGIAVITPFSLAMTAFVGAVALVAFKRLRPATADATLMSVAAGGIAGEAVMGVIIAAVIATGLLPP